MSNTEKPIFKDCAFPEDCQCAARGYQWERENCAVPHVEAAAESLGLSPPLVTGFRKHREPIEPGEALEPVITRTGDTILPLPDSGDVAGTFMSPDEHRALRNRLGLSAGAEARLLGVGRRTVERWDSGNRPVSGEGLRLLRLLELELDTKASLRVRGVG